MEDKENKDIMQIYTYSITEERLSKNEHKIQSKERIILYWAEETPSHVGKKQPLCLRQTIKNALN